MKTWDVLSAVWDERDLQDIKWGEQTHPNGTGLGPYWASRADLEKQMNAYRVERQSLTWLDILAEEVFEAFAEHDPALLRAELIQVAAVAVAWVQAIDRG
jgi:hypothetical protein